jgi:histone-lysine N-methyltransferase SETMAR
LDVIFSSEAQTSKVLLPFELLLLHHNARPHCARTAVNLLNTWQWEILPHPPYSLDLATSAFHLFPKLKEHIQEICFQPDEGVHEEVKGWLSLQGASFYQGLDSFI